jgi:hypothetical protein
MAELALVSSVAGLVSLGISVSQGILQYYDAYRSSHSDINTMCESIEALGKTLVAIWTLTKGRHLSDAILETVATSICSCQAGIEGLQKKLDNVRMVAPDGTWKTLLANTKKKTLYPLRESTLIKMREICSELKDNLSLAIDVLSM